MWENNCTELHLPITEEEHNRLGYGPERPWNWTVAKPKGEVFVVEKSATENRHYVSVCRGENSWPPREFKFRNEDETIPALYGPIPLREGARKQAEEHRNEKNIENSLGSNWWRFVLPNHAEIRFPRQRNKIATIPLEWWETIKDTYTIYCRTPTFLMYKIPEDEPNSGGYSIAHTFLDISKGMELHFIDGKKLHCCPRNVRAVWPKNMPDMGRDKVVHIEPTCWPDGDEHRALRNLFHWHCERWIWHLIPEGADHTDVPPYVENTPHSEITVELHMGFRYWKVFNGVCNANQCRQKREVDTVGHWHEDGCIWHRIPDNVTPYAKYVPEKYFEWKSETTIKVERYKGDTNWKYWVIRNSTCYYDRCSELKPDQPPYTKYAITSGRTPAQIGQIMEEELRTGKRWEQLEQEREAAAEEARRAEEANKPKKRVYDKSSSYWENRAAKKKPKIQKVPWQVECRTRGCKTFKQHITKECPLRKKKD